MRHFIDLQFVPDVDCLLACAVTLHQDRVGAQIGDGMDAEETCDQKE
jgi:hypothetical protein